MHACLTTKFLVKICVGYSCLFVHELVFSSCNNIYSVLVLVLVPLPKPNLPMFLLLCICMCQNKNARFKLLVNKALHFYNIPSLVSFIGRV